MGIAIFAYKTQGVVDILCCEDGGVYFGIFVFVGSCLRLWFLESSNTSQLEVTFRTPLPRNRDHILSVPRSER